MTFNFEQLFATLERPEIALSEAAYEIYEKWKLNSYLAQMSSSPIFCSTCKGSQHHQVARVVGNKVTTQCLRGHLNHHTVEGVLNEIRADYTREPTIDGKTVTLAQCIKLMRIHFPVLWKSLVRHRYSDVPKNYKIPENTVYLAFFMPLSLWKDSTMRDARRILLIGDRLLNPAPMCQWVEGDFFQAISSTSILSRDLAEVRRKWDQGIFFLPPGSLITPSGHDCPFIAFAFVEEGLHSALDVACCYWAIVPKFVIWTMAPESMETFTGELSLAGQLKQAQFHPIARPKDGAQCEFVREVFRLALLLNVTAEATPGIAEQTRAPKKVKKKGKRYRNQEPTLYYTAPTLGLKVETEYINPNWRNRAGTPMPPHWRPGWEQRYRKGSKKGEQTIVHHWRPPMFINGSKEDKP